MNHLVLLISCVLLARGSVGIDLSGGMCLKSSNCGPTQFCDHDFPNPIGKCKDGLEAGERCLRDKYCKSKKCSLFHCEAVARIMNGSCDKKLKNIDCPPSQYCKDDKCVNRKCLGFCRKNSQCMSDHCHLLTCVKSDSADCTQ